jgi:mono/diheme cytochrome c family protein
MVPIALLAALGLTHPALAAEDGKKLYDAKCAMCHGMDGVAKKMAAGSKNFNDPAWKKEATSDGIVKIIHDGRGKMKGLGDKVTEHDAKEIAEYLLTLAK